MLRLYRIDHSGTPLYAAEREGRWRLVDGDIFGTFTEGPEISSEGIRLLAPVTPSKIVCVGLNYKDHAAEQNKPLPPEPLRIAFRGLHTDDPRLRGTALEYLEGVLPPRIREQLWPFLEDRRPAASRETRPRDEILADLLRSHESIMINLEELQRRAQDGTTKPWPTT